MKKSEAIQGRMGDRVYDEALVWNIRTPMRRAVATLCLCASLAAGARAAADGSSLAEQEAHAAYDRGTAAYKRGDYQTAAREYAAADRMAPNIVALQAALDAAIQADDPVLGTQLVERASRLPEPPEALVAFMVTAKKKFANRTGRIKVACDARPCLGAIDGAAASPGEPTVVRVGSHEVTVEATGHATKRIVTVEPEATVVVTPPAEAVVSPPPEQTVSVPPPAPPPGSAPPPSSAGLSPVWFFTGLGLTAVAGGLTIASGIDTAKRHSDFQKAGCPTSAAPGCSQLETDGEGAQSRTNVLLAVTAAFGVATALTAFVVRWRRSDVAVAVSPGRAIIFVRF